MGFYLAESKGIEMKSLRGFSFSDLVEGLKIG